MVITLALPRVAAASCGDEAVALREHLETEARRARTWNLAWAVFFGAAAAGQVTLALTETKPLGTFDDDDQEMLYVGAGKATIGAAARVVLPLRIAVPDRIADACSDVVALRAAVAKAGRIERRTVWLTILGGTAVNVAGSLLLWQRRDGLTALQSFGIGAAVSPISAFTQPRGSWRLWHERRATWTFAIAGRSVWLAGEL